ncbi:MAG: family 16 glycosylhydrolase [Salinivirgaceae bacterium]|jgi:beta-glucanase (GH16 family)|nr:family 16 glycosylhydrolase [Salinivirgaceae bacterium]
MKNKNLTFTLFLVFALFFNVSAQWKLKWSDEFNYSGTPDASKWNVDIWDPGNVNNEWQAYTNRSENLRVENGNLVIEARRDWGNGFEYTSGRINSGYKGFTTYGRIEARIKLPGGWGTWPAFWMMPNDPSTYGWNDDENWYWPNCGEIDIMEEVGYDQNTIHGSVHSKAAYFKLGTQRTGHTTTSDVTANYHVFAIEWFEDHIDWFVDDNKYYTVYNDGLGWEWWPFNYDFHVILNLAVGGDWGGAQGVDPNIWPRQMLVDYVRIYEADPVWTISLQGSNGQFVSSENGQSAMMCNRPSADGWEKFDVIDAGDGKIALRGTNGLYVSSENGQSAMMCNRNSIGGWEAFKWVDLGNYQFALQGSNGMYVSSENGTTGMMCNRNSIGGWETFTFATTAKSAEIATAITQEKTVIDIYPNPVVNIINIPNVKESDMSTIYDSKGSKVLEIKGKSANVSDLKNGIYLLNMNGKTKKFIKQ